MDHVGSTDVEFKEDKSVIKSLVYRKAKITARPLLLRYPYAPSWDPGTLELVLTTYAHGGIPYDLMALYL